MNNLMSVQKIAFIGSGSMGEAIIRGLLERKTAAPEHLFAINRSNPATPERLNNMYGIKATCDADQAAEWIRAANVAVIAMKPKDAAESLRYYRRFFQPGQLLVSVIAGLSIATIEALAGSLPVVRTMPNTSSNIGLGATGLSFSPSVSDGQRQIASAIFAAIGEVCVVEEKLLDIVTGVSGSGPAYIYHMMEAMIAAGIQGGLPPETAHRLTVQTVLGAASMVKQTGEQPGELRRKVTSPNGTTQAALETLADFRFADGVQRAVLRAAERAGELGRMISEAAAEADGK